MNDEDDYQALLARLVEQHGEVVGGHALSHCLGFRTTRAFQMAAKAGRIPVPLFELPGRRGRFARTMDVARWLVTVARSEGAAAAPG